MTRVPTLSYSCLCRYLTQSSNFSKKSDLFFFQILLLSVSSQKFYILPFIGFQFGIYWKNFLYFLFSSKTEKPTFFFFLKLITLRFLLFLVFYVKQKVESFSLSGLHISVKILSCCSSWVIVWIVSSFFSGFECQVVCKKMIDLKLSGFLDVFR